jgi:hypothetical protein
MALAHLTPKPSWQGGLTGASTGIDTANNHHQRWIPAVWILLVWALLVPRGASTESQPFRVSTRDNRPLTGLSPSLHTVAARADGTGTRI